MKKTMTYKNRLVRWGMAALLPLFASGCLMEEPELTADGELGVDPTSVNVEAEITLDLEVPAAVSRADDEDVFSHRIIVEAYLDNQLSDREVVYEDPTLTNRLQTKVGLNLHARNYKLAVWVDRYNTENDSCLYDASDLTGIVRANNRSYGNTENKDAFFATADLDLTPYRNEWGAKVDVEIAPRRAVGRYTLIATDVADFRQKIADGEVAPDAENDNFRARLTYNDYLPVGFNAKEGITRHAFRYVTYNKSFRISDDTPDELELAFDYVFVNADEEASIPVTLEVYSNNASGDEVIWASTTFRIRCVRGENTAVRSNFLTADPEEGVGIDPDFDGHEEGNLGAIEAE